MTGDLDLDAAEYVIGTLDQHERASFADRLSGDAGARAAVAAWELRLLALQNTIPAIAPPAHLWPAIERALDQQRSADRNASSPVHDLRSASLRVIPGGRTQAEPPSFKRSRDRWRGAALAFGTVAAALLVVVVGRELQPAPTETPSPIYVAAVNRGGDKPALIVRVDLKTRQVLVRPIAAETPAGRSLELWYIGDGKPPRSMGLVDTVSQKMTIPRGASDRSATFAVSVEPPGGSTTGAPTGPVVYAGQLVPE